VSGETLDVVILGAGPAGCATAIALRERGRTVALLERAGAPLAKVGEHLRPEAMAELRKLGLSPQQLGAVARESPGIRVAWGSPELRERDYLFDPFGSGWNVLRAELEAALVDRALQCGGVLHRPVNALGVKRDADDAWLVGWPGAPSPGGLRARWVVDATGRRAWLASQLGARRERADTLVALVGRLRPARVLSDADRLLVESAPEGWWYSVGLPDESLVVAYLTDSDLLAARHGDPARAFGECLPHAPHTALRAASTSPPASVSVHGAETAWLAPAQGPGWIAVGDSAWSSDPLAGIGVSEALASAREAAREIDGALERSDGEASEDHARAHRERVAAAQAGRLETYRQELRWAERPFWKRRHADPGAPRRGAGVGELSA